MTTATRATATLPETLAWELRHGRWYVVSPRTGQPVLSGYAVGVFPDCDQHITGRVAPDDIRDHAYRHAATVMPDGRTLTGWVNPRTAVTTLGVALVVHDRGEALALARRHNQTHVTDLTNDVEVAA